MHKKIIAAGLLVCLTLAACRQREPPEHEDAAQPETGEQTGRAEITPAAATNVGIEVREAKPAAIRESSIGKRWSTCGTRHTD